MLTWLAMASHYCFYFVWMASISICTYCKQDAFCCYLHLAKYYHNISQWVEIANALIHSVSNEMHGQLHGDTKECYEKKKWPNLLTKQLSCQGRNMLICQSDTTRKLKQRSKNHTPFAFSLSKHQHHMTEQLVSDGSNSFACMLRPRHDHAHGPGLLALSLTFLNTSQLKAVTSSCPIQWYWWKTKRCLARTKYILWKIKVAFHFFFAMTIKINTSVMSTSRELDFVSSHFVFRHWFSVDLLYFYFFS